MTAVHAVETMPQWLLLDVPGSPQVGVTLKHSFDQARRFWLFEGTEWHAMREQGPLLINLRTCPMLAEVCQRDAQHWRGLLLISEASASTLLAHLRRMLTVSFGLHHRALLSYYNPHTASYFFDACDAGELSRWLGPISQLRWFGGTWADRAFGSQGWQKLFNPGLAVDPLAVEENLSTRQREKLQTCLLEHHTWRWCKSSGTDYSTQWSHLQEGLALGFSERAVLDGWLWLRLQYPDALPQLPLSGATQQERLDSLGNRWQNQQS
ncbi:DUF4123 domain-containing protein [Pseudomonas sp. PCH199]|uniref:DUF4123 domain-containing protein n=1 Tax=unclassified Pseudomonas TaxID=196821 RepID=UPI000BD54A8C|nr:MULTISPECIES: DUF4123 domain-containing protein [unclassified Pseudomonas]MCW8276429.1 DUF4123 domain-containing protein [Pseudomonas sp. PCH199]PAM83224.1 hypothetical protein CES87_12990 [Pseudomonas sp. ERMR1:02]